MARPRPARQPARRRALLLGRGAGPGVPCPCRVRTFAPDELTIETSQAAHVFTIELAATPGERERGLMYRQSMPVNHGMLFDFRTEQPVAFWMKNTPLPLDMLFIDGQGIVVQISADATPFSETPIVCRDPIRAVLELNAGTAAKLGIAPGARVRHPIFGDTG